MKGSIIAAITLPFLIAAGATANSQVPRQAGLRLKTDEITTTFRGYLTQFLGDCPGQEWSGPAASNNIRFISFATLPAEDLRVQLTSLTTGESLEKAYEQESKGSSDFSLQRLGVTDGTHEIEYQIFNKRTDGLLEEGVFAYTVLTSQTTRHSYAQWQPEQFCASHYGHSLQDCHTIGWQERRYCHGVATGYTRCDGIVRYRPYLRRRYGRKLKHKHLLHGHQKERLHQQPHLKQQAPLKREPVQAKQRKVVPKASSIQGQTKQPQMQPQNQSQPRSQSPRRGAEVKPQTPVKEPQQVTKQRPQAPSQPQAKPARDKKAVQVKQRETVITPPKLTKQKPSQPAKLQTKPKTYRQAGQNQRRKTVTTAPRKPSDTKRSTPNRQRVNRLKQRQSVRSQPKQTSIRSRKRSVLRRTVRRKRVPQRVNSSMNAPRRRRPVQRRKPRRAAQRSRS